MMIYNLVLPGIEDIPFEDILNPTKIKDIGGLVSLLLPILFILAGIALLFYLIAGGLKFITSTGDPKAIQSAKNTIVYALVGFFVVFSSFFVLKIVSTIFNLGF
jgi:hypothetical protein